MKNENLLKCNTISIKIPTKCFAEIEKFILKFTIHSQGSPNSQNNI